MKIQAIVSVLLFATQAGAYQELDQEPPSPPPAVVIEVAPSTVQDSIDRAVRFLRSSQDPETGQYGSGVEDTARVLIALANSPRKYRVADGPFIGHAVDYLIAHKTATGLVVDASATGDEARVRQTLLAAMAFARTGAPGYGESESVERQAAEAVDAAIFARVQGSLLPNDEVLEARALLEILGQQLPSGAYQADATPASTAQTIGQLTVTWKALRAKEVKSSTEVAPLPTFTAESRARTQVAMRRGAKYLVEQGAVAPGRWGAMGQADPGITAMVLGGLLALPEPRGEAVDQAIDSGIEWILTMQHEDGSIHAGQLANYVTSASVMALAAAKRPELAEAIGRARGFLTVLQADEGEGYKPGDRYYGGVGYGGDERPDLSNLQMAVEALAAAGADAKDPAMLKALRFLERTQNRKESNDTVIEDEEGTIRSGDDGGAGYMPGDSKAGFVLLADGTRVPQSYGSMTFALLKSFLLAGLAKDDPRVQAAFRWIERNYTLDRNPGFEASSDPGAAYQGLFYYFLALSRALELFGDGTLTTPDGAVHDWRDELAGRLISMQLPDGSWVNNNSPRWYEGNPTLATAYALLSLGPVMRTQPQGTK